MKKTLPAVALSLVSIVAAPSARAQSAKATPPADAFCIAPAIVHPDGSATIPWCHILASPPFSFSKEDRKIYDSMLTADSNATGFQTSKIKYGDSDGSLTSIIAESVKAFKEQRALFCGRHADMWIFDLDLLPGGGAFSETPPEPCNADK